MTLAEIMAGARAGQSIGQAQSFTNLTGTAADERRALADARRQLEEQQKERERQAAGQEKKRGRGRLIGSILGGLAGVALAPLTGGLSIKGGAALGAGLGSFAGQKAAGDLSLDDVSSGLAGGMFFSGAREDISGAERDVNRFLSEAEDNFKQKQFTSAIGDAFTGYNVASLAGNPLDKFKSEFFKSSATGTKPLLDINLKGLSEAGQRLSMSGGSSLGSLGDLSSIGRFRGKGGAFDVARNLLGDNQTFSYGGRQFTTSLMGG
jgi:hypothetical protein